MKRPPPRSTRTDTLFPYTTLFRTDAATFASEIGTNRCRSLHSNHMAGHIWEQFGSETLRARPPDPSLREAHDGGRSYYRNISLPSLWAHAPLMHNNAVCLTICGKQRNKDKAVYRKSYSDAEDKHLPAADHDDRDAPDNGDDG